MYVCGVYIYINVSIITERFYIFFSHFLQMHGHFKIIPLSSVNFKVLEIKC